jgi:hypothetical protein
METESDIVDSTGELLGGEPEGAETALSRNRLFSLLSNRRRRLVLYYLEERSGVVRLRDLAAQIAAWENDVDLDAVTYKQRKRVYTSLYQSHLPKMHDDGVVEYDQRRGTVTLAPGKDDVYPFLDVPETVGSVWISAFGCLSLAGFVVLALTAFAVGPFAALSGPLVGMLVCSAVFLTALAAAVTSRR